MQLNFAKCASGLLVAQDVLQRQDVAGQFRDVVLRTVNSGQPEFYRSALEVALGVEPGMATPEWMEGYVTGAIKPNARAIEVPEELDFRG